MTLTTPLLAQPPSDKPAREIFVPFDDLNVLLEGQTQRIFLTRKEYEELLTKAKDSPAKNLPLAAAVLSADYNATAEEGRVKLQGKLDIEVLAEGLTVLPLDLWGVGVRSALVDGQPASIGRGPGERPVLFVTGPGKKQLTLEMVAALETSAAVQGLQFELPVPASTRFKLAVPGNVEIKTGADVLSRAVDAAAGVTRFEILPRRGRNSLVMSLNNRLLLQQRAVVARSVLVDEITSTHERLGVTVSLGILHGAVDRFRFVLPEGFEATGVDSPLLAKWSVETVEGKKILDVLLREPTTETVLLHVAAVRAGPPLKAWTFPRLEPLDVVGQVAVVGLLVDDQLKPQRLVPEGLLPINVEDLAGALPPSLAVRDAKSAIVRPVAAWYAPQAAYKLAAEFVPQPSTLQVVTSVLLELSDEGERAKGGFTLSPTGEKLFTVEFIAPPGWQVTAVTGCGIRQNSEASATSPTILPFETFSAGERGSRIQLRLPHGVAPGESYEVKFQAVSTAPGWLAAWKEKNTALPVFSVVGATRDTGAVSVRTLDDLTVRPDKLVSLLALDDADRGRFGLAGVETNLAFRYEAHPYSAALVVERTIPTLTARAFSFFRISPEGLAADYELLFDLRQATTRRLAFRLPAETPGEISIRGLGETVVKETTSVVKDGERHWSVLLADKVKLAADASGVRGGSARLAVRFEERLKSPEPKDWKLPLIKAEGVTYQSGVAAVEGSPDLDIEIKTHPRAVDVGDLAAAEHQPGRRLLGVFGYLGVQEEVKLDVFRRPGYGLPSAIIERAELVTLASASGLAQTAARYRLRSKALFLEVELPPDARLWSVLLDGKPLSPQVDSGKLLISLPSATAETARDVQLVYETNISSFGARGRIETPAPRLYLRAEADSERREVPAANLIWHLHVPSGYRVVRSDGTVFSPTVARRKIPGTTAVAALGAGAQWLGESMPSPQMALKSDKKATSKAAGSTRGHALDDSESTFFSLNTGRPSGARPERDFEGMPRPKDGPMVTAEEDRASSIEKPMAEPPMAPPADPAPETKEPDSPAESKGTAIDELIAKPQPDPKLTTAPAKTPAPGTPARLVEPGPGVGGPGPGIAASADKNKRNDGYWALEGVRSLAINLRPDGEGLRFESLGVEPKLSATLVDGKRFDYLAAGVGLLVLLFGLVLTREGWRIKLRYVVIVLLAASLLPLIAGTFEELDDACDLAVCAAILLSIYYVIAAGVLWTFRLRRTYRPAASAASLIALAIVAANWLGADVALAQPKAEASKPSIDIENEPLKPVAVPEDAVIIPYDPDAKDPIKSADKLLVPYDKYVELWNRAFPDKPRDAKLPPAPYALAGASFEATLSGDEFLLVTGQVHVDVFAEGVVEIPLPFSGGVLSSASLDGKPARLRVVAAKDDEQKQAAKPAAAESLVVLYASGLGRKKLELAIRFPLARQGGWRIAEGRLPAGTAAALALRVADANTEVRLSGVVDRRNHETKAAGESIETALATGETLRVEWRPKVAQAEVDRGLTARSQGLFDVREDGLRLVWQVNLEFARGRRESFVASLPAGYLVERVAGGNVRGWQLREEGKKVEITLLKAAVDRESLTLYLSRRGPVGQGAATKVDVPAVTVEGAALQQGAVSLRRGETLDVRTTATTGVSRTDNTEPMVADPREAEEASPLPLRAFQSYRFAAIPFTISLEAAPVVVNASAEVQTLVHVAEHSTTLAARLKFRAAEAALHRVRVAVPKDLAIERLEAPGSPEWGVTDEEGQRVLTVYLPGGARGEFFVSLFGSLGKRAAVDSLPLPNLKVLDVSRQQGEIAVLADSGLGVSADELNNCESVLLERAHGWLTPEQRELTRLVLVYRAGDYAGLIKLAPRTPRITGYTITNVRVTSRTIEETIFLEFNVEDGGVREFTFQLPGRLKEARIRAKNLRQTTVKEIEGPGVKVNAKDKEKVEAATVPAVSVWLELQDQVRGRFQVIVEHDRLRSEGEQVAPLTALETGRIDHRFVVLENASPDELVVDGSHGFESLGRQQRGWQELAAVLGEGITSAYVARENADLRRLAFHLKQRAAVATAAAKIGIAETKLVLDGGGAYRAATVFRINNRTEQFLEIELPAGAELWTARVAGSAVKPTAVPGSKDDRQIRIPLVKTEEGDDDYEVILKYGGRLPRLSSWSAVKFPLLVSRNINVETSQVRLWLPETHAWYGFGGKMRFAESEEDLQAGYLAYRNRQIEQLTQVLSSSNSYARMRSENNLKQLGLARQSYSRQMGGVSVSSDGASVQNEALKQQLDANTAALQQAETRLSAQKQQLSAEDQLDNRDRLNYRWNLQGQSGSGSGKVAQPGVAFSSDGRALTDGTSNSVFNKEWLGQNKLEGKDSEKSWNELNKGKKQPGPPKGDKSKDESGEAANQPAQPLVSNLESAAPAQEEATGGKLKISKQSSRSESDDRQSAERYKKQLEVQSAQTAQPQGQAGGQVREDKFWEHERFARGGKPAQAQAPQAPPGSDLSHYQDKATVLEYSEAEGYQNLALAKNSPDAYLASLDVEFPERGQIYRFTTPRGEVEVTARALSAPLLSRLLRAIGVGAVVLVVVLVGRVVRNRKMATARS